MQNYILEKLKYVVSSGEFDEPVVMYILVEIRKLSDQGEVDEYSRILFMADWVVHHKLSYQSTKILLKKLENDISRNDHGKAIIDLVSFQEFRAELMRFFSSHCIDASKLEKNWNEFSNSLFDIVSDCPLENLQGERIKKFVLTKRAGKNYEYRADIVPGSLASLGSELKNVAVLEGKLLL